MEKLGVVPGEEEEPKGGPTTEGMLELEAKARRKRAMRPGKPAVPGPAVFPGASSTGGPKFK
jgi:hypothetical protein